MANGSGLWFALVGVAALTAGCMDMTIPAGPSDVTEIAEFDGKPILPPSGRDTTALRVRPWSVAVTVNRIPALDVAPEAGPDLVFDNGCTDTDSANNYLQAGYVVYTDEDGQLILLYDTCKIEGKEGMLKEVTCEGYHGPDTKPAELESKFIKCNCHMGECVEDSVVLCTEPEAGVWYPGGSVWTNNEEGKTHISVCVDESTVDWYYCNDDGTFHTDVNVCPTEMKCGDGMCGGFVCTDTEPPSEQNPDLPGQIFIYSASTGESWLIADGCSPDSTSVKAYKCPLKTGTTLGPLKANVKLGPDYIPCQINYECLFGICVESESPDPDPDPDPEPEPEPSSCQDSDPEDNIYVSGQLVLTPKDGPAAYFPDQCSWYYEEDMDNPGTMIIRLKLLQYSCVPETGKALAELYVCAEDEPCVAGACMLEAEIGPVCNFECVDTDGGPDIMTSGSMYATSSTCGKAKVLHDLCTDDETVVLERYCDGDTLSSEILPCPPGHFCRGAFEPARCVACKDSDVADDPAVLGMVDDIDAVHISDFCNKDGQLKQAQCNLDTGLAVWGNPENCPLGTTCIEGMCN